MFHLQYIKTGRVILPILMILSIIIPTSCGTEEGDDTVNALVAEYAGVTSTADDIPSPQYCGFYVNVATYADNSCHIGYALNVLEEGFTLHKEYRFIKNRTISDTPSGFQITDAVSGRIIATGEYCGVAEERGEVSFDFVDTLFDTWAQHSKEHGWQKPIRLLRQANLLDDIVR